MLRLKENNGIIQIPIELVNPFITNPLGSLRDYACIPTNAIHPFFTDFDKLDRCLRDADNRILINPFDSKTREFMAGFLCEDSFLRYIHIDLAIIKDGVGISMCHIPYFRSVKRIIENKEEGKYEEIEVNLPFIKFDFTGRIVSENRQEILISTAQDLIFELAYDRGFIINLITFDRFESTQTMQILRDKGFNVAHLSLDKTAFKIIVDYDKENNIRKESTEKQYTAPYECLRYAINEGRIEIPEHIDWYQETRGLEYNAEKNIVIKSPHSSDDLIQSIAGSAFNASNNELAGIINNLELNEEDKDMVYDNPIYNRETDYNEEYSPELRHENYNVGIV